MHSTEGVILKKSDTGEADALFTIYTKDFGKIRALAKGVKKGGAKLRGHAEILNHSSVSFVRGRSGERLVAASALRSWPKIKADWGALGAAYYVVELIDRHCLEGEKDEPLWDLLIRSLLRLDSGAQEDLGGSDFFHEFGKSFLACLGYSGEKDLKIFGDPVAFPFYSGYT